MMNIRALSPFRSPHNFFLFTASIFCAMMLGVIHTISSAQDQAQSSYIRQHQCVVSEVVNGEAAAFSCDAPSSFTMSAQKLEEVAVEQAYQADMSTPQLTWNAFLAKHACQPAELDHDRVRTYRCKESGLAHYLDGDEVRRAFDDEQRRSEALHG